MPPPSRIVRLFWELALSGELFRHIDVTLTRVMLGFVIGSMAGTVLGAASGAVTVRRTIDPTVQALRAIPSIASSGTAESGGRASPAASSPSR